MVIFYSLVHTMVKFMFGILKLVKLLELYFQVTPPFMVQLIEQNLVLFVVIVMDSLLSLMSMKVMVK